MRLILLFFAAPLYAANLPCTVAINIDGNASVSCSGTTTVSCVPPLLWNGNACVLPTPPIVTPPVVTPANCAWPANGKAQPIFPGGSGNYAFDSFNYTNTGRQPGPDPGTTTPANSIQIYKLPITFNDGSLIHHGQMVFGDFVLVNNGGTYEVSISKCPGDFETYKKDTALAPDQYACGLSYGPNFSIQWAAGDAAPFFNECRVPAGEQWYLNWRVRGCPTDTGHTCGNIFTIPYGG